MQGRAEQGYGDFDPYIKDEFTVWRPKDGRNVVRFLPVPETWEQKGPIRHFGLDLWIHWGVGTDNASYLCRQKMGEGKCPICEELAGLRGSDDPEDEEYVKTNRPQKRVLAWIIDRADEDTGPQLWPMPFKKIDEAITELINEDAETMEMQVIEDVDEGCDASFKKSGKGLGTEYKALRLRKPSPLSDDPDQIAEWLDFIAENPVPSTLKFYSYDYINSVFGGKTSPKDRDDDDPKDDDLPERDLEDEEPEDEEDEEPEDEEDEEPEDEEDEEPEDEEPEEPEEDEEPEDEDDIDDPDFEPEEDEDDDPEPRRRRTGKKKTGRTSVRETVRNKVRRRHKP